MREIDECELDTINGGADSVSATVINALTNLIKLLQSAGYSIGSVIRRIGEGSLCPLD